MEDEELVKWIIIAILSLATIAVWIRDFKWANRELRVKDAQIATLLERIETLKDFGSDKLYEYFIATKEMFESYVSDLEEQRDEANINLKDSENELKQIQAESRTDKKEIVEVKAQIAHAENTIESLSKRLNDIQPARRNLQVLSTVSVATELNKQLEYYGRIVSKISQASTAGVSIAIEKDRERIQKLVKSLSQPISIRMMQPVIIESDVPSKGKEDEPQSEDEETQEEDEK